MAIKKYRKKPVIIEAVVWNGENKDEIIEFCGEENVEVSDVFFLTKLYILTLEGKMEAALGDYIIKGVNGEFYPCKASIFKKTYDVVEEE